MRVRCFKVSWKKIVRKETMWNLLPSPNFTEVWAVLVYRQFSSQCWVCYIESRSRWQPSTWTCEINVLCEKKLFQKTFCASCISVSKSIFSFDTAAYSRTPVKYQSFISSLCNAVIGSGTLWFAWWLKSHSIVFPSFFFHVSSCPPSLSLSLSGSWLWNKVDLHTQNRSV